MTEADLQEAVIDCAHLFGWRVAHFRPALTRSGRWATPVAADGAGWPDLSLAHPSGRVRFAELKSARGVVTPDQAAWLGLLRGAGLEAQVWRPEDWTSGRIERELRTAAKGGTL